jgi:hypothetical protein
MTCYVHGKLVTVSLVQENAKTVWVRLPDGQVVKRHKVKHRVEG